MESILPLWVFSCSQCEIYITIVGILLFPLWNLITIMGFNYVSILPSWVFSCSRCGIHITIVGILLFPLWNLYYYHGYSVPSVESIFPLWVSSCSCSVEPILPSWVFSCSQCGIYITIVGILLFPLWSLYYLHGYSPVPSAESLLPPWVSSCSQIMEFAIKFSDFSMVESISIYNAIIGSDVFHCGPMSIL